MNDNEGPWVELSKLQIEPLKGGKLRVIGTVRVQIGTGPEITTSPAVEASRDATIRELERALLESVHATMVHAAALTPDQLQTALAGCREEMAIGGPLPGDVERDEE